MAEEDCDTIVADNIVDVVAVCVDFSIYDMTSTKPKSALG